MREHRSPYRITGAAWVLLGALAAVLAFGVASVRTGCDEMVGACAHTGGVVATTDADPSAGATRSTCCALAEDAPAPPTHPSEDPECSLFCTVMCKAGDLKAVPVQGTPMPVAGPKQVVAYALPRAAPRVAWRVHTPVNTGGGREILAVVCVLRI